MQPQVNAAEVRLLAWVRIGLLAWAVSAAAGCSGCEDDEGPGLGTQPRDGGMGGAGFGDDGFDAGPFPTVPDAGRPFPGEPPPELAGELCAVDTNKLYELVAHDRQPVPAQLGVDLIASRFSSVFIADSEVCLDAVYLSSLQGASGVGMPELEVVSDECTTVLDAAVARVDERWLVAMVDARMDQYEIWVQPHDGVEALAPQRVTNSLARESDVVIAGVASEDPDSGELTSSAMVAWVERDDATGTATLKAQPLSPLGEPAGDAVVLQASGTWSFASLSMTQIGQSLTALGYRRFDRDGRSQIVLDVLSADTAERDHDSWVLTTEAGPYGSIELAADTQGGGVIYSLGQGDSAQIWFQQLDASGRAASVRRGNLVGGPAEPRRVVAPPANAIDASMAKLPVGYAVAYRALPGTQLDTPRIRVHFLHSDGNIIGMSDVALASEFGGRTAIEAAYDGRIVLGWSDLAEDGTTTITVAKLPCVGG